MSRLTPDGVFTVSRWYSPGNVDETGRMISLAVATLMEMGVSNPRNHIFLVSQDNKVATLVMGLAPLSAVDVAALTKASADLQHPILLSPNQLSDSDTLNSIVSSRDMTELETITSGMALDLTPPRDNRPFFFNQLPLNKPLQAIRTARRMSQSQDAEGGVVSGNLAATMTLMMLFVLSTILVIVTIIVPIRSAVRDVGTALAAGGTLYFLFIGIGFMMVEIGLLQRTSVFLGHPIYSLSVLLFTLILSAGIGSLLSDLFALTTRARFTGWAILTGAYILALPVWAPQFMSGFEDGSLLLRAMICISIIAPAGLLMGYGFPTGIAITSAIDDRPTPWFWGINGAAGVLASIVAVATSIANGISATLTVGAICYLILIPITLTLLWPGYEKATKS
jgi:hypothetical protein